MKKLLAVFACMLLAFSLAACAEKSGDEDGSSAQS